MFRKKWPWVVGVLVVARRRGRRVFAFPPGEGHARHGRERPAARPRGDRVGIRARSIRSARSTSAPSRWAASRSIGVREGDRVKAGQFLLQIDPVAAAERGAPRRGRRRRRAHRPRAVAGARCRARAPASTSPARPSSGSRSCGTAGLTTRENLEKAEAEVQMRESDLNARTQEIQTREEQVRQQEAGLVSSRYNLSQARFESPFDGIVTRRNIEEGENVVVGTMNNAGTVLLTVADMSVIEAEVEVDETDIPLVQIGQKATVTIDAIDGKTFSGRVTEIGNSPIQRRPARRRHRPAHRHQFQGRRHARRGRARDSPGLHLHRRDLDGLARRHVVAVPIQALTVRELEYDKARRRRAAAASGRRPSRWSFGAPAADARPAAAHRTAGGPYAQGNRGRVRDPRRQGAVRHRRGRHRRRALLRGGRRD